MTSANYPQSVAELRRWAKDHDEDETIGRRRFAQFLILQAVASTPGLANAVFKGGNALDLVLMPNRSTLDLDFTLLETDPHQSHNDALRDLLDAGLATVGSRLDVVLRVQSVTRNPKRLDASFPTYQIKIGYALPDQARLRRNLIAGETISQVVPIEVSVNDVVCEWQPLTLPSGDTLSICTLDDIVAEKLRALLQQIDRKRHRPQDVLDIATAVLTRPEHLHEANVADFLQRKAAARDVSVSRTAFEHEEVWTRAAAGYAELDDVSLHFIPFDEARAIVLAFVRELDLPTT